VPVGKIRIASRNTQGVIIFRTGDSDKVVSVERLAESGGDEDADEAPDDGGEVAADEGGGDAEE
jgi:DNA gyrase subunit A